MHDIDHERQTHRPCISAHLYSCRVTDGPAPLALKPLCSPPMMQTIRRGCVSSDTCGSCSETKHSELVALCACQLHRTPTLRELTLCELWRDLHTPAFCAVHKHAFCLRPSSASGLTCAQRQSDCSRGSGAPAASHPSHLQPAKLRSD